MTVPPHAGYVLVVEDDAHVRVLRLNRPGKLNALDTELTQALYDALRTADEDPSVRAVILAGNGRAFCAGADIGEFKELTPAHRERVLYRADLTCRTQMMLQHMRKPIVSVVHGAAMGGGAGLAIGCDMMVAATDLELGYPEIGHSIVPALVMTGLQRQVGRKLAFEMISTGRTLSAGEAAEFGLANAIHEPGETFAAALAIARGWAGLDPAALSTAKNLFYRVADLPFEAAMRTGRDVNAMMRSFRGAR